LISKRPVGKKAAALVMGKGMCILSTEIGRIRLHERRKVLKPLGILLNGNKKAVGNA
jgi:hypothetical protein